MDAAHHFLIPFALSQSKRSAGTASTHQLSVRQVGLPHLCTADLSLSYPTRGPSPVAHYSHAAFASVSRLPTNCQLANDCRKVFVNVGRSF